MKRQSVILKILQSFLARIIIGLVVIAGLVAFSEWSGRLALENSRISSELKNVIISISDSGLALAGYIYYFLLHTYLPEVCGLQYFCILHGILLNPGFLVP